MSTAASELDILLLQARDPDDPALEHEIRCFVDRTSRHESCFHAVNVAESGFDPADLEGFDFVTVGGAGDYSLVEDDAPWIDDLLETMRAVVDRKMPMFASCFGFQAVVLAHGGRLVRDPARSEVGTFEMRLTERGADDEFFGRLPETFDAQLGHKDSVVELPDRFERLAYSERCPVQAVRIPGRPIYATQFHPELRARDNIERYARYIEAYKGIEESREDAMERARAIHRESPEATRLLAAFLDAVEAGQLVA